MNVKERLSVLQVCSDIQSVLSDLKSSPSIEVLDRCFKVLMSLTESTPTKLTEHFTVEEFLASPTAVKHNITLTPNATVFANLRRLCVEVLEPARKKINKPLIITSGYRSQALNRLVGGVPTSLHLQGRAADIVAPLGYHSELFRIFAELPHVELIDYKTFIHVAL